MNIKENTDEAVTWMIKTYSELSRLFTFAERFRYLKLDGAVGQRGAGSGAGAAGG